MVFYKKSGYLCSPLMFKQSNFIQSSYLGLIVGWTAFACSSSVKPKYLVEYYLEIKCLWAYKVFVSWKELISHQIASVEISTVSKSVWLLQMAETYWQAEGLKAARSWLFLTRRKAWNNFSQSTQTLALFYYSALLFVNLQTAALMKLRIAKKILKNSNNRSYHAEQVRKAETVVRHYEKNAKAAE